MSFDEIVDLTTDVIFFYDIPGSMFGFKCIFFRRRGHEICNNNILARIACVIFSGFGGTKYTYPNAKHPSHPENPGNESLTIYFLNEVEYCIAGRVCIPRLLAVITR